MRNILLIAALYFYNFDINPSYSEYAEYIESFSDLTTQINIDSLLEFRADNTTQFFLEHCKKVTSVAISLPDQPQQQFQHYLSLYKNYPNWIPEVYTGSTALRYAESMAIDHKDPSLQDATYLLELKDLCDGLFAKQAFDAVVINPDFHLRGDLVNELFDRTPIIVAHGTNDQSSGYGWEKIQAPCNYEKIHCYKGEGTTFWIRLDREDAIWAIKKAPPQTISQKKLRVFFPHIHGGSSLTRSMAIALKKLGHTLLLPGESFYSATSGKPRIAYKIQSPEDFKKENPDLTYEFIEFRDLILNPPDVVFINAYEVERDIYEIFKILHKKYRKTRSIKLAHYAGNNAVPYDRNFIKNLLVVDAFTEHLFKDMDINIEHWIPWIESDSFAFEGTSDQKSICSYLANHYSFAFPIGSQIYREYTKSFEQEFPEAQFHNLGGLKRRQLIESEQNSAATLHIKDFEGFGYTIVESLLKGRPVFLKRTLSQGNRLMNWCIEGKTALFFDTYEEFREKMDHFLTDDVYRHEMQIECARTIRRLVDNDKQTRVLEHFLQTLH